MRKIEKLKIVVSDTHLSAGRRFEGRLNPHEDFKFDDELCDLVLYYSSGDFGDDGPSGVIEKELVLAGDFFDFLNVPVRGEFPDQITEEISVYKVDAMLKGHARVSEVFRKFVSHPHHRITYLMGNHDADLVFEQVRRRIISAWDPQGLFPSEKVRIIYDQDRITFEEGFEIRHGNLLDPGNEVDLKNPLVVTRWGELILGLPWSSAYVLKIINRLRWDRPYLDKVRPAKALIFWGFVLEPFFTVRFAFLSAYFFVKTRLSSHWRKRFSVSKALELFQHETRLFRDLEVEARQSLDAQPGIHTIIFGHTHKPMDRIYPDGKQYINTGTWTRMINMDWSGWGQGYQKTYALIRVFEGKAECELREWVGHHNPHRLFE